MGEIRKEITGYDGRYEITKSGKIISVKYQRFLARCNDEYGYHIVKLTDEKGESKNHNLFELWREAFPEANQSEFKGALKPKYGTGCNILKQVAVHF